MDAALNGFVLPFLKQNFHPLKNTKINSLCVDLHKAGMIPLPCGVILYKKSLTKYIKHQIPYSSKKDLTISGSRSGIPPVAAYMTIMKLGKKGYKKILNKSIKLKKKFIQKIENKFPNIEIIDHKDNVTIGIVSTKQLSKKFTNQYGLYAKKNIYHFKTKKRNVFIYKATFIKK